MSACVATVSSCSPPKNKTFNLLLREKARYNFILSYHGNTLSSRLVKQNISRPPLSKSRLCVIVMPLTSNEKRFNAFLDDDQVISNLGVGGTSRCANVSAGHYKLSLMGSNSSKTMTSSKVVLHNGGVYTGVVQDSRKQNESFDVVLYEDLEGKSISMFWQVPQYFVITSGEILFSITGEKLEKET